MRSLRTTLLIATSLAVVTLAACTPGVVFNAPEIEPPADLIPEYVPQGFELVSGFEIRPGAARRAPSADAEGARGPFPIGEMIDLGSVQSPAGNMVQGVQYRNGEEILLITKSEFPGGTLDLWREAVEPETQDDGAVCECAGSAPLWNLRPPRVVQILEEHVVDGVPVAVIDWLAMRMLVFVRGDHLLTIQGGISIEEGLRIVESLLP